MLIRDRQQVGEGGEIAVHGEHAVGHDQRMVVLRPVLGQQCARMADIVMAEHQHFAARELRAGENAGVRQFIRQHQPVAADRVPG